MKIKMRILLPIFQMAIALALILSNRLRPFSPASPSWTAPDRQFCDGLNAPATLIRIILIRFADILFPLNYRIEFVLETVVFVLLVGLLWYAVSIELGGTVGVFSPRKPESGEVRTD